MRIMMHVTFPTERFNAALKAGTVGPTLKRILDDIKPEAAYFGERSGGERGATVVVNIDSPAQLPIVSEPWYLAFGAKVEISIVMTLEETGSDALAALAKKYG